MTATSSVNTAHVATVATTTPADFTYMHVVCQLLCMRVTYFYTSVVLFCVALCVACHDCKPSCEPSDS